MPKFNVRIDQTACVTVEASTVAEAEKTALQDYNMGFDNVTYHEPTVEYTEELPCQPITSS